MSILRRDNMVFAYLTGNYSIPVELAILHMNEITHLIMTHPLGNDLFPQLPAFSGYSTDKSPFKV